MAVSAAGAPLGSEQMDFENSALGELAEEDMLDGMGGLCYDSDEIARVHPGRRRRAVGLRPKD